MVAEGTEKDQARVGPEVSDTDHEATGEKPGNGGWRRWALGNGSLLLPDPSCFFRALVTGHGVASRDVVRKKSRVCFCRF